MLGTQGVMDREARCGLERRPVIVVALTGFGKTEPGPVARPRITLSKAPHRPGYAALPWRFRSV
jgi:hypothetical protein